MRWSSFTELVAEAKGLFREHGYLNAEIEVCISEEEALRIQHEPDVATLIIDAQLHASAPVRPGMRLFAVAHDVRVYVKES